MVKAARGFTLIEMMVVIAIIGVFIAIVFSLASTTYGASPATFSDQVSAQLTFARSRAIATKRAHQVEITPTLIQVKVGNEIGLRTSTVFDVVQQTKVPNGVVVWNAVNGASATPTGGPGQNPALDFIITINADGSSSNPNGATVYLTDAKTDKKFRVLLYSITGSSYARPSW